jgi:rhodanese-related sulfurtransferase
MSTRQRRVLLALAVVFALAVACAPTDSRAAGVVSADEVKALIGDPGTLILDVRTPGEFRRGHIPGARNVPVQNLANRLGELPQDKQIVVYCRTGNRSSVAQKILMGSGFSNVANFEDSWVIWTRKDFSVQK